MYAPRYAAARFESVYSPKRLLGTDAVEDAVPNRPPDLEQPPQGSPSSSKEMAALATHVRHAVGKALRETGSAMERAGMALGGDQSFWDHTSRHTTTVSFADAQPCIAPDSFVAPSATIYGAASVGCLLYTSPSPRDATLSRMPSSA